VFVVERGILLHEAGGGEGFSGEWVRQ
jgi:hypothetical protein